MTFWYRWVHEPQRVWLRRALFQVHLWTGIALGAYVVVICVSGSALVFRNELTDHFTKGPTIVPVSGERLTEAELRDAALRGYPETRVTNVWPAKGPDHAVEVWLDRKGKRISRLFDPYTGQDLGRAEPEMISLLVWLAFLHDELLYGDTGVTVNGVLGLLLVLISLTGIVIWWPGIKVWRRSLVIEWNANWKRLNWTLHSAIGFWTFLIVFGFAFTGFYLVFQGPFMAVVDYFEPITELTRRRQLRTGDLMLRWLSRLHFGRYGGWPMEAAWVVLGLIPPILFMTGALMYWNRVLGPALRRLRRRVEPTATTATLDGASLAE